MSHHSNLFKTATFERRPGVPGGEPPVDPVGIPGAVAPPRPQLRPQRREVRDAPAEALAGPAPRGPALQGLDAVPPSEGPHEREYGAGALPHALEVDLAVATGAHRPPITVGTGSKGPVPIHFLTKRCMFGGPLGDPTGRPRTALLPCLFRRPGGVLPARAACPPKTTDGNMPGEASRPAAAGNVGVAGRASRPGAFADTLGRIPPCS